MDGSRRISGWPINALRGMLCLGVAVLLGGCAVGGVVAGLTVGILAATSGDSTDPGVPVTANLLDDFAIRDTLRAAGDADTVPIRYRLSGPAETAVCVEFAREADDFSRWLPSTRLEGSPPRPDGEGEVFWWCAAEDLDLEGRSERVRVRVYTGDDPAGADVSPSFFVGNTGPEVEFLPTSDDVGQITLSFSARDLEADPLLDPALDYRMPESDVPGGSPTRWEAMQVDRPLETRLDAPAERAVHSREWDSRAATDGNEVHNVRGLAVRLRWSDHFGVSSETATELDVRNNNRSEARLVRRTVEPDESFEVPVYFRLFDEDSDPCDIVIQYAVTGVDLEFPELDAAFDDPVTRREILQDPDERRRWKIATPSARRLEAARVEALETGAEPDGRFHSFLWDTRLDLDPLAPSNVRLRITPFDEERSSRPAVTEETDLTIDNDVFPTVLTLAEGTEPDQSDPCLEQDGKVIGVAVGDLDGDERPDLAVALPEDPVSTDDPECGFPPEFDCAQERGSVAIYLRQADGLLPPEPSYSVIAGDRSRIQGFRECLKAFPMDLAIADANGDGKQDLLVLARYCERCGGCSARGDVSIFLAEQREEGVPRLPCRPQALLRAGNDVRGMCIGEFDGIHGVDIAVANHDADPAIPNSRPTVGVFRRQPDGTFSDSMEIFDLDGAPERITCADFDGDGLDEILLELGDLNLIEVVRWSQASGKLERWSRVFISGPEAVAAGDFDGDTRADLAVARADHYVSVFLSRTVSEGVPPFDSAILEEVQLAAPAKRIIPHRLQGGIETLPRDGLVALEAGLNIVEILRREGPDSWLSFKEVAVDLPGPESEVFSHASSRDIDGDGCADIIVGSARGVHVLRAQAAGSLVSSPYQILPSGRTNSVRDVRLEDLNGDGRADIVAALTEPSCLAYRAAFYYQGRLGEFSLIPDTRLGTGTYANFQDAVFVAGADTDADGSADTLALGHEGGGDIFVHADWEDPRCNSECLDDPLPIACPVESLDDGLGAQPPVVGEFDGEPGLDLLRLDRAGRSVLVAGSIGDSDSPRPPREPLRLTGIGGSPRPAAMAALGGGQSGLSDLVVLFVTGEVQIRLQRAGVTWPENFAFVDRSLSVGEALPGGEPVFVTGEVLLVAADRDGSEDDLLLLVTLVETGQDYVLLYPSDAASPMEDGGPRFESPRVLEAPAAPSGAVVGDFTGDDLPDIALSVPATRSIAFYHQRKDRDFPRRPSWAVPIGTGSPGIIRVAAADLTGDSRLELVVVRPVANEIQILRTR